MVVLGPHEAPSLVHESQGGTIDFRFALLEGWAVMTAGTGMYGYESVAQRNVWAGVRSLSFKEQSLIYKVQRGTVVVNSCRPR